MKWFKLLKNIFFCPSSTRFISTDVGLFWSWCFFPSASCSLFFYTGSEASHLFNCINTPVFNSKWSRSSSEFLSFAHVVCAFNRFSDHSSLTQKEFKEGFLFLFLARFDSNRPLLVFTLCSHSLISHSLTLEVMNKSPSAESSNLLYCLHRGEYPEKTLIRPWTQVEFTLLGSFRAIEGDDIVFFSQGGLDVVDELV